MSPFAKGRQIFLREPKQPHGRTQAPAMLGVRWMFELLLEMDESPGRLDEALEILLVLGADGVVKPDLLKNIMRFVIALLVPALKKSAIIGMVRQPSAAGLGVARFQGGDET